MRRLRSPRALAVLAVPVILAWTATSLHPNSVESRRAVTASATSGGWTAERSAFLGGGELRAGRSSSGRADAAPTTTTTTVPKPHKVRPAAGAVTGVFGEGRGSHRHPGLDIDGSTNDPVLAAYPGVVEIAGWAPQGYGGYGIMIVIDHGMGVKTLYGHLAGVQVQPGQQVAAGQLIATMGSTGYSTGSHLHFEVFVGGGRVDPAVWLAEP
jgi:murein DD-endopeptidase MepM/ murein hydrolase activator NlpD